MNKIHIKMEGLSKSYNRPILKSINLEITNESLVAIVGKSGAGKSTLMNILGLMEGFDGGSYFFNGQPINNRKDYSILRRDYIGFIFQSFNLIPTMSCRENILLPTLYSDIQNDNFHNLVERLHIAHLLDQTVNLLSGGEKQRVAIARALILDPALIIADEPTGNLDEENSKEVLKILLEEHQKGRGVVMITHDNNLAKKFNKQLVLRDGELYEVS